GDGVNIAARLERLAEPGGICISREVYNQVRNKLALDVTDMGEQRIKNIGEPVQVFRVNLGTGPAGLAAAGFARDGQEKPSLAVLPFVTSESDPDLAYVSEGISEELIGDLARLNGLFVVARSSSFMFRDGTATSGHAAPQLGVRYLLGGTVRPGDEVAIDATLVDSMTGKSLWSGSYSCGFPEIFKIFGMIVGDVAEKLVGPPDEEWRARASRARAATPEAYEALLKGRELYGRMTPDDDRAAHEQFSRAIAFDPTCAEALGWLAMIHQHAYRQRRQEDEAEAGAKCARAALALDDNLALAHHALGYLQLFRKRFLQAQFPLSKAVGLDGNDSVALSRMGLLNCSLGKASEALELFHRAARLNPCHAGRYLGLRGMAFFVARRYDEALEAFNRMPSPYYWERAYHAATFAMLGRIDNARHKLTEVLHIMPSFAVDRLAHVEPFQSPDDRHHFLEALRRAGLPT
ncbi:MAG: adenylate/guanylate cyclase domain-containing protein, partial [Alphaproteobacteria bacterium]